jgi:hypothetical protein
VDGVVVEELGPVLLRPSPVDPAAVLTSVGRTASLLADEAPAGLMGAE